MLDQRLEQELSSVIPHLRSWAARFETKEYDADLLVSDTVISFLERPESYNPKFGSLRNFLFSFLKNKALDFTKSYNRKYKKQFRLYLRRSAPTYVKADPATHLEEQERDLFREIDRQLETLPPRQAEAFRLFAFKNMGCLEIAEIMEVAPSNVKSMIHRIRIKLRRYLRSA